MSGTLDIAILQSPGNLGGPASRFQWLESQLQYSDVARSDLLILPELFQCGYQIGCDVVSYSETVDGPFAQQIQHLAITHNVAITYGYAEKTDHAVYNSAQCIDSNGHPVGHHRKMLLPPGFEPDVFASGNNCEVFTLGDFKIAILICYDFEFPENMRKVAAAGAELVIVPTALNERWGVVSEKLVATRAFENGVFVAYANHCGRERQSVYFGGSCIAAPDGHELARADITSQILTARITRSSVNEAQQRMPYLTDCHRLPWN